MKQIKPIVLGTALVMMLVGCDPSTRGEVIQPQFDRSEQIIRLKVVFHDTLDGVRKAKQNATGQVPEYGLVGFAGWNTVNTYCEVHVVRPKHTLDDNVSALGHEALHCVYGSYHKEGESSEHSNAASN